jgi:hypothetical protein
MKAGSKWTPEQRKNITESLAVRTPEEKAATAKKRSESIRASWERRKRIGGSPASPSSPAQSHEVNGAKIVIDGALTATDCISEASIALVKFLRLPVEQLKTDLADPLQIMRLKGEAIHLANHAEEIISMIEHVKRTQEIGKAR